MTPNKLPPLPEPTILPSGHYVHGVIVFNADQMRAYAITHAASLQAKIDALMLEYCPDDMTPEQMQTWAAHQVPSSAAKAEALRQSQSLPAGAVDWVAVPREPTDAMLDALRSSEYYCENCHGIGFNAESGYSKMLDAATKEQN